MRTSLGANRRGRQPESERVGYSYRGRHPSMATATDTSGAAHRPYFTVAGVAVVVAGLLMPKAAYQGLDRGLLVWLIACITSGLIVSNVELSVWRGMKAAMLMAGLLWLTVAALYAVRWLISRIIQVDAPHIKIPFGSGASVDLLDPEGIPFLIALLGIFWVGSTVVMTLTALSGRLLVATAVKLYDFGPERLDRVRKIIVGMAAVAAALVELWAAFS